MNREEAELGDYLRGITEGRRRERADVVAAIDREMEHAPILTRSILRAMRDHFERGDHERAARDKNQAEGEK